MSELRARPWRRRRGSNHSGRSFTLEPPVGHLLGGLVNICSHKDDNPISLQLKKNLENNTKRSEFSQCCRGGEGWEEEELRLLVWTRLCSPEGHPGYCYSSSLQKSPKRITHRCSRKTNLNDDREWPATLNWNQLRPWRPPHQRPQLESHTGQIFGLLF